MAPTVSHVALSRTINPCELTTSLSVYFDQPLRTFAPPNVQPDGTDRTQGTSDAEGTDWASSHNGSSSRQPRWPTFNGVSVRSSLTSTSRTQMISSTVAGTIRRSRPMRRGLQCWIAIG